MEGHESVRSHRVLAVAVAVVAGLSSGWAIARAASGNDGIDRPRIGTVPKDVDGDGLVSDVGEETYPEFIGVVGDHGVVGYSRLEDLRGEIPSSPEEALDMAGETRVIPVYADDGVTQVDTLTETDGDAVVDSGSADDMVDGG